MRAAVLLLGCGLASCEAFVSPAVLGRAAWQPTPLGQAVSQAKVQQRRQAPGSSAAAVGLAAVVALAAVRAVAGARSTFAGAGSQSKAPRQELVALGAHKKPTKKGRKIIVMECVEQRQMVKDGIPGAGGPRGGVSRYYTEKNVRNVPQLLELKKYNKYLGRHTVHRELK